jgi:ubiquitin-conjugating enzyme E2 Z
MSSNPYENEPGFENAKSSSDKKNMAAYVSKVGVDCCYTVKP